MIMCNPRTKYKLTLFILFIEMKMIRRTRKNLSRLRRRPMKPLPRLRRRESKLKKLLLRLSKFE